MSELQNRELILHKKRESPTWTQKEIAKSIGTTQQTVSNVLRRYNETLSVDRAQGSGKKSGPVDKKLHQSILRSFRNSPGSSYRDRAKKFGTSIGYIQKTAKRAGYKSFKAIKVPNRNEQQNLTAGIRARRLYDQYLTKFSGCWIQDDETYVKLYKAQIPGHKNYMSKKRLEVADKHKFIKLDKFPRKVMIWRASSVAA